MRQERDNAHNGRVGRKGDRRETTHITEGLVENEANKSQSEILKDGLQGSSYLYSNQSDNCAVLKSYKTLKVAYNYYNGVLDQSRTSQPHEQRKRVPVFAMKTTGNGIR